MKPMGSALIMTAYDFGRAAKNPFSNGLIKKRDKITIPNTTTERISREVIRKACVKKSISSPFLNFIMISKSLYSFNA